jgi:glucose/mannose transport system substrate-binding protein
MLLNPATQVAFNLKKGSLPVRGDVDITAANDCMKKGLEILAKGNIIPDTDQLWSPRTPEAEGRSLRRVLQIRR